MGHEEAPQAGIWICAVFDEDASYISGFSPALSTQGLNEGALEKWHAINYEWWINRCHSVSSLSQCHSIKVVTENSILVDFGPCCSQLMRWTCSILSERNAAQNVSQIDEEMNHCPCERTDSKFIIFVVCGRCVGDFCRIEVSLLNNWRRWSFLKKYYHTRSRCGMNLAWY